MVSPRSSTEEPLETLSVTQLVASPQQRAQCTRHCPSRTWKT